MVFVEQEEEEEEEKEEEAEEAETEEAESASAATAAEDEEVAVASGVLEVSKGLAFLALAPWTFPTRDSAYTQSNAEFLQRAHPALLPVHFTYEQVVILAE